MGTADEKKAVADSALRAYHAEIAKEPQIAAKILELQNAAKTYMEAELNG